MEMLRFRCKILGNDSQTSDKVLVKAASIYLTRTTLRSPGKHAMLFGIGEFKTKQGGDEQ